MKETKKNITSFVIGVLMFMMAGGFIAFALQHPEFSFPWNLRTTFMLYGVYIWFMFKFLIDIPIFRKNKEKKDKNKRVFADNLRQAAERLAYTEMIQRVRKMNEDFEKEGVEENEATN